MKMESSYTLKLSIRINRATGKKYGLPAECSLHWCLFKLYVFKCCYVIPTANLHNRGKVESIAYVYTKFDPIVLVP
jgi:hypothetical protein